MRALRNWDLTFREWWAKKSINK